MQNCFSIRFPNLEQLGVNSSSFVVPLVRRKSLGNDDAACPHNRKLEQKVIAEIIMIMKVIINTNKRHNFVQYENDIFTMRPYYELSGFVLLKQFKKS
jgi:hypothetical protein